MTVQRLLSHLHRGGEMAHLWTDFGKQSLWFHTNGHSSPAERRIPAGWMDHNVYFTVNPLSQMPPENASGNTNPRYIASQDEYIAAVNVLFGDFDGKDYVTPEEYASNLPPDFATLNPKEQKEAIKAAKE